MSKVGCFYYLQKAKFLQIPTLVITKETILFIIVLIFSAQFSTTRLPSEIAMDNASMFKTFSQKSSSSSSTLVVSNSSHSILSRQGLEITGSDVPPAVPEKTRRKTTERQPSPYDNVPEIDHSGK